MLLYLSFFRRMIKGFDLCKQKGSLSLKEKLVQLQNEHAFFHLQKRYYREYVFHLQSFIFFLFHFFIVLIVYRLRRTLAKLLIAWTACTWLYVYVVVIIQKQNIVSGKRISLIQYNGKRVKYLLYTVYESYINETFPQFWTHKATYFADVMLHYVVPVDIKLPSFPR